MTTMNATVPTRQIAFDYDRTLVAFHGTTKSAAEKGKTLKRNANTHKYRDCAVFNYLFAKLTQSNIQVESVRAVFVPLEARKGLPRLWNRSGVFRGAHIQISVRESNNILAVWPVRRDGRYGKDEE